MKNFPYLPFIIFAGALITTATVGLPVYITWDIQEPKFLKIIKSEFKIILLDSIFDFFRKEVIIKTCVCGKFV